MTDLSSTPVSEAAPAARDFIRDLVAEDMATGRHDRIVTRFPPEPNGYLHIGHAKSICLNFGIARDFGGICHLRMDDTNPTKEEVEYVDSITADVRWLVAGWADQCLGLKRRGAMPVAGEVGGRADWRVSAEDPPTWLGSGEEGVEPFFASDYFEALYGYAVRLVEKGLAYVCDLTAGEVDQYRGAPDRPGQPSPYRDRSVAENLDWLGRMRAGEFPDGTRTLRAKIEMTSPNVWLRDPVLYRIRHAEHHQTGKRWCVYPLYDFAHCLSDYLEGITHSVCTLEFEVHRPLYDWILENLDLPRARPHQYEFARLNLSYTVMSKRKLLQLVNEGLVSGWDDPRMPTLSGLRRRGVRPEALREFARTIGVTKFDGTTDMALLEHCLRQDLNAVGLRRMAVMRPLKVVLTNVVEGVVETVAATNNPEDPEAGMRRVPFGREVYIERDDFHEDPPKGYFRLRPGGEVRLKYAGIIRCDEVVRDEVGAVVELRCTLDEGSRTGGPTANRKIKGTIHWVSVAEAVPVEVRLYDRLFTVPEPDADGDFRVHLNPASREVVRAWVEPSLAEPSAAVRYQWERLGYFAVDPDSRAGAPVFNRIVSLRDSWAKKG
jgi:glutaminyl-tRNA synthetase